MSTPAADVLKPDFAASRRHFIFTEEHDRLRESIHAFVVRELAPARGGVGGDDVPRLGVPAHGRARPARALLPGGVRRPGRRLPLQPRARRGDGPQRLRRARDGHRGPHRHGDAADPPVRHRGAEAALPRALDRRARRSPASGSPSPTPAPTSPASARGRCATAATGSSTARRRTSPTATAPTTSCSSPRPTPTPATTGSACSSSTWTCRAWSASSGSRSSACTRPTPRCSPSRTCASRATRCSARRARASTTSCGSSRASG